MKSIGIFFLVLALFGFYALVGVINQQGFKKGPYHSTQTLVTADADPRGFLHTKLIISGFSVLCLGIGVYCLRKKK